MTNDRFRDALTIDASDLKKAKTKGAMGTLMRIAGYRRECYDPKTGKKVKWSQRFEKDYKVRKVDPSQEQLKFAWSFIHEGQQMIDKKEYFEIEEYKKRYVRRATESFYYKGKLYKKGQFLPKGVQD